MAHETLARCRPNGHPLALRRYGPPDFDRETHAVLGPNDEHRGPDDGVEFEDGAEAWAHYEAERLRLRGTPNPEAQAAYDAEWGTDGGRAPWDRPRER